MAIGDIAAVVINAIIELVGTVVFGGNKPSEKQKKIFWVFMFLFIIFLLWLTITFS